MGKHPLLLARGLIALAGLAFGTSAHGASLTLEVIGGYEVPGFDAGIVFGDTFEVRVTGDAMGMSATGVFAQLLWTGGLTFLSSSQVPMTSFNGSFAWSPGQLTHGPGFADVLSQISSPSPLSPDTTFSGSIFLIYNTPSTTVVSFSHGPNRLDFFGVTETPQLSLVPLDEPPIPEPATALLLSLGLATFGISRRRAS